MRAKMCFPSREKALAFVRYNGEEVLAVGGRRLTRAYYCAACAGWHLTSSSKKSYTSKFQKSLQANIQEKAKSADAEGGLWKEGKFRTLFNSGLKRIERTRYPSPEDARTALLEVFEKWKEAKERQIIEPAYLGKVLRRIIKCGGWFGIEAEIREWCKCLTDKEYEEYVIMPRFLWILACVKLINFHQYPTKGGQLTAFSNIVRDFDCFCRDFPEEVSKHKQLAHSINRRAIALGWLEAGDFSAPDSVS